MEDQFSPYVWSISNDTAWIKFIAYTGRLETIRSPRVE